MCFFLISRLQFAVDVATHPPTDDERDLGAVLCSVQ